VKSAVIAYIQTAVGIVADPSYKTEEKIPATDPESVAD
jgi:hypothetical protein